MIVPFLSLCILLWCRLSYFCGSPSVHKTGTQLLCGLMTERREAGLLEGERREAGLMVGERREACLLVGGRREA